jgi:hypothetical protein
MPILKKYKEIYKETVRSRFLENSKNISFLDNKGRHSDSPFSFFLLNSFHVRTIGFTDVNLDGGDSALRGAQVLCQVFYLGPNDVKIGPIEPFPPHPGSIPEVHSTGIHQWGAGPSNWNTFFFFDPNDRRRDYNNGGWILELSVCVFVTTSGEGNWPGKHLEAPYGNRPRPCGEVSIPHIHSCYKKLPWTDPNKLSSSIVELHFSRDRCEAVSGTFQFEIETMGFIL